MKPLIKGLSMSVLAMSILLPSSVSFANENIDSSQTNKTITSSKPPSLDPEEGKKIIEIGKEKAKKAWEQENQKNKINRMRPPSEKYSLNVTHFKQTDWFYCGPASARSVLTFHKSDSGSAFPLPTERILASLMQTTNQGTNSLNLAWGLNAYKDNYDFADSPYGATTPSSIRELEVLVKNKLSDGTNVPIVLTNTQHLARYKNAEKNYRHFIVINGYQGSDRTMEIVDPNHKRDKNDRALGGEYTEKIDNNGKGVGKAVLSATGSNPTLVY
ncbi:C39 family peptidase [Bacillus arachidis]|uniref:C39 family peptidase n=1 Tax=Bacillus arachidis TaxID=2819290 RepID=UPI00255CB572|nr:C39 family peptidase [Bacillus arachidis]WIY58774.1 C39 family peptidase [Bacillus arachidis]